MTTIDDAATDRIAALFDRHLTVGLHHGAQLAVFHEGEPVLDLAGGVTDPNGDATTTDTRHLLFSSTKPFAAALVGTLLEDGSLSLDDQLVDHWPEFADPGSQKAAITVDHVLTHTAGLAGGEIAAHPERWPDWAASVATIERMTPTSPPGADAAYHAVSYSWLVGELVARVTNTPVAVAAEERVFDPLDLERTGIGSGADEPDDVATLVGFDAFDRCRDPGDGLGADHTDLARLFDQEQYKRAVMPSSTGIGTARDLARFYACLAGGGTLEGRRLLAPETVDQLTSVAIETVAEGTLGRPARFARGFWKGGTVADPYGSLSPRRVFGHAGLGSSVGWADPDLDLAVAYVTNGVRDTDEHVLRCRDIADAVRLAIVD